MNVVWYYPMSTKILIPLADKYISPNWQQYIGIFVANVEPSNLQLLNNTDVLIYISLI